MKRYLSLSQEITAQQVLNIIGEIVNKTMEWGNDRVLVLEVKHVSQETIMLPLLEYKNDS